MLKNDDLTATAKDKIVCKLRYIQLKGIRLHLEFILKHLLIVQTKSYFNLKMVC